MIASRRIRLAVHVACMEEKRNEYETLIGKCGGNERRVRSRRRWEYNIQMDFKGVWRSWNGFIWLRTETSSGLLTLWWTLVFRWLAEELLASEECDLVCYDVTMNVTWDLPATRRHSDILVSRFPKRSTNIYVWAQFTRSHHMYVWMQPLSYLFLQPFILPNRKFENAWKFLFVFQWTEWHVVVVYWNGAKWSTVSDWQKIIPLTFFSPIANIIINNG